MKFKPYNIKCKHGSKVMLNSKKILAVIQARGGSKGIPGKNIYPIDGHPLIAYTIEAAKASKYIDCLIVSTDSLEIAEVSRKYGAQIPFIRPAELSGDTIVSVESLAYAARESERVYRTQFDIIIELPCVAPLRDGPDIDAALEKLISTGANSVISVVNTGEKHPVRLKRIVDDQIMDFCKEYPEPSVGSRRQDLEPCHIRNGAIYSMTRHTLLELGSRHGPDSRPYEMPEERSLNIDGWMDLRIVDLMVRDGQCKNTPRIVGEATFSPSLITPGKKILITAPLYFMPKVKDKFFQTSNCLFAHGASEDSIVDLLRDIEGWLCSPSPTYLIGEGVLAKATKLKVIATPSTGSNHIDKVYCERRGIKVISLKDSYVIDQVHASSEYTFALLLAVVRRLPYAFDGARRGFWRECEERYRGIELFGKTLGLIGYGRIGRNMARFASTFGMKIRAFDPYVYINEEYVIQDTSHKDLLKKSDVIAVCVHLDDSTNGMVNEEWFALMKKGAYFINTSRGEVVNEVALLDALKSGKIALAGVDVVSNEQQPDLRNHPLISYARKNNNLIVTPHIAGLTVDSETKTALYAFEALIESLGELHGGN